MLLSQLSPHGLVPWRLPHMGDVAPLWAGPAAPAVVPLGFLQTADDAESALTLRGELDAQLEMYGGPGLGGNAGGVRCANYAGFQVKGTGPSALAGLNTDKWHKHGALSLQDAIRETIMGELIHVASPHGAVRALAIVDLGFDFRTEVGEDKLPGSAPRALLYRELSVRVAHFMRSSFMHAGPALAHRELDRMRDGIPRFVDWLRIPLIADTHSRLIADSVPGDRGHPEWGA